MEAKHWFGIVAMGALLVGASFAINERQAPGDLPGARPLSAGLMVGATAEDAPAIQVPVVSIPRPTASGTAASEANEPEDQPEEASDPTPTAPVVTTPVTASGNNALVGHVIWEGASPKNRSIDMSSDPVCQSLYAGKDAAEDEKSVVKDGKLVNVIVYIDKVPAGSYWKHDAPVVLNQVGCVYVPHVVAVQLGQEVKIQNSDATTHNVHFKSKLNGDWNLTQSTVGTIDPKEAFAKAEIGTPLFKCDIHPWMEARVGIFDHPFFAVSKDDGTFEIKTDGLPDGTYDVVAWHEKYKTATAKKIAIKQGQVTQLQFSFNKDKKNKGGPAGN